MGTESIVVRMHSGNGVHPEMDERAEACFAQALEDTGLSSDPRLRSTLITYFHWANQTMSSHPLQSDPIPDGLVLARWSWEGPVNAT